MCVCIYIYIFVHNKNINHWLICAIDYNDIQQSTLLTLKENDFYCTSLILPFSFPNLLYMMGLCALFYVLNFSFHFNYAGRWLQDMTT